MIDIGINSITIKKPPPGLHISPGNNSFTRKTDKIYIIKNKIVVFILLKGFPICQFIFLNL
ncbi:hypothetical protein EAH81_03800 [Flavobacterium pectinovorum]|uniref:Uncharacterized protein n=1 Tax=Flavobacterium pectinovorum TaxID=29533 RepID=A0A502F3J7_9FLAO|nr:hypothetical protein EAH81_03800 [Flavobacterium pectinovorum]